MRQYPNERCSPDFKPQFSANRIAILAKLLDMGDAANLIKHYMLFPEEIVKDLPVIEALINWDIRYAPGYISDLLRWYDSKAMGINERDQKGIGLIPKSELNIFKIYSELRTGSKK